MVNVKFYTHTIVMMDNNQSIPVASLSFSTRESTEDHTEPLDKTLGSWQTIFSSTPHFAHMVKTMEVKWHMHMF